MEPHTTSTWVTILRPKTRRGIRAFGHTTVGGAASTNSFQYTGRENDGTGLYYYRNRYYSPRLQRFISEDPADFGAGDANLYAYVRNGPLKWRDTWGLKPGDFFPSEGAAGIDALDYTCGNKDPTVEWGGTIYRAPGGRKWTYSDPVTDNNPDGVTIPLPSDQDTTATYHTHTRTDYHSVDEPDGDVPESDRTGLRSYLGGPGCKVIRAYDPRTSREIQIR